MNEIFPLLLPLPFSSATKGPSKQNSWTNTPWDEFHGGCWQRQAEGRGAWLSASATSCQNAIQTASRRTCWKVAVCVRQCYLSYWSVNILETQGCRPLTRRLARTQLRRRLYSDGVFSSTCLNSSRAALSQCMVLSVARFVCSCCEILITPPPRLLRFAARKASQQRPANFPFAALLRLRRTSARLCGATALGGSARPSSCQLPRAPPAAPIWWLNTCSILCAEITDWASQEKWNIWFNSRLFSL